MASKTMYFMIRFGSLPLFAAIALMTTGCEQENDRTLAQAQSCLDQATSAAAANVCVQKIAGLESQAAYLIRCSANFIGQGFTGDRIAKAYERLSNGGSGVNDPTLNLMGYLIFQNDAVNSVEATVNNCTRSGSTSMERLSRIADLATSSAKFGDFDFSAFNPEADPATLVPQLQAALDKAVQNLTTTATLADIQKFGETALATAQSLCVDGSSFSTNDVCATMNTAVAASKNSDGSVNVSTLTTQLLNRLSQK